MNLSCRFAERGDHNDCAHAGGGRAAPASGWCASCRVEYRDDLERTIEALRRFPGTASVEPHTVKALENLAARVSALERSTGAGSPGDKP